MSNKIIVNTGARNGIGEATAIRLAGDGHHVVVTARRTDRLAQIADRIAASGPGNSTARRRRRCGLLRDQPTTRRGRQRDHSTARRSALRMAGAVG